MLTANELLKKRSHPMDTGLPEKDVREYLKLFDGWFLKEGKIMKTYSFKNYYETLAFVNAVAFIVHREDHHPEMMVSYNQCVVKFNTHSVNEGRGGISENDFICAAKIDALVNSTAS
ncbi:4a-hydroxytetrahydrobiopterin dehydratase [uncultured Bdellovibrio sp.]|uniref:4a-hydroxytetrahydrobiopterin dehydratase n=1 Tax=Bdellovibrio sp. HCB-162 TaxID=3394234 RepID=UPI0025F56A08|nr:4a-hydroxytetrahydrobiopterin dehydratase [uncultured Bdellovibrio sp.]